MWRVCVWLLIGEIVQQLAMDELICASKTLEEMASTSIFEERNEEERNVVALPEPESQGYVLKECTQSDEQTGHQPDAQHAEQPEAQPAHQPKAQPAYQHDAQPIFERIA